MSTTEQKYELALLTGSTIFSHHTPHELYDALAAAFGEITNESGARWVSFAAGSTALSFWRAS